MEGRGPMTEQQMPARIWAERTNEYDNAWVDTEAPGCQAYIRADLAERMAEALETHQLWEKREKEGPLYPWGMKRDDPGGEEIWRAWWEDQLRLCSKAWEQTDAALSAFRSATQGTEARHDDLRP
jgi:hypothetical protein